MGIGRGEICPCGSGKKFKKCCIGYKYSNIKLNNNIQRKYMCEFGLHTYSSKVNICYPSDFEYIDTSQSKYHIYMINKIKRLSFVKGSLKIYEEYIEVTIQQGILEEVKFNKIKFSLGEVNHIDKFTGKIENNRFIIIIDKYGRGIKLGVLTLFTDFSGENLTTEILYVGQSYGRNGERDALKRLSSHSTLQRILADTSSDIESEIVVTLWEFTPKLNTFMNGAIENCMTSEKEDLEHFRKVLSAPPLLIDNQIINITEAALINYFKPRYNEIFKNNFPDINHKGYKFYYDYDYNSVCVELDPSCINIEIFSKHIEYSQFDPIIYQLNSEEDRKSMFDIE
ncbi:SEC-C metal-binding domain-containing protein [Clostridium tertium]